MQLLKRSPRGMTIKCSVWCNNIPMDLVKSSIMQLSRRHTDKLFNMEGGLIEIEKMMQTLERRLLHLIAAKFRH